jgi:hypothetical protein
MVFPPATTAAISVIAAGAPESRFRSGAFFVSGKTPLLGGSNKSVLLQETQHDLIERRRIFQTTSMPSAKNNVMFRASDSGAHFLAAL